MEKDKVQKNTFYDNQLKQSLKRIEQTRRKEIKNKIFTEEQANFRALKSQANSHNKYLFSVDDFIKYASSWSNNYALIQDIAKQVFIPKERTRKEEREFNNYKGLQSFLRLKYDARYNVVSGFVEIKKKQESNYYPLTDYILHTINREALNEKVKCDTKTLQELLNSSFSIEYNPLHEYLKNLPKWDGKDHIKELAETVKTNDNPRFFIYLKRWLLAAVASILYDDIINQTVLVFSGEQGTGKSMWQENMIPNNLKQYLFSGTINPNNKDSLIYLSQNFIGIMDELNEMTKHEIGDLKQLITKRYITVRRPYERNPVQLPRRASLLGSVNGDQFLTDTTGNRRFLVFSVNKINYMHKIDMDNVYAQALELLRKGERFYFDKEEIDSINLYSEQFRIRTPEEELLLKHFVPTNREDLKAKYLTATDILNHLRSQESFQFRFTNVINMGRLLSKHKFEKVKKKGVFCYVVRIKQNDDLGKEEERHPDDPIKGDPVISDIIS